MEHLSLEVFDMPTSDNPNPTGSKYAVLPEDASITVTETSEIFSKGDVWTYSFTLNVAANAHLFGTAGEIHGSRLHEQIDKRKARLWIDGLPFCLGYLKLDDEAEVDGDGNAEVSFWSGRKTFDELIENAKANQVPLIGDVKIGMALWRKRWVKYTLMLTAYAANDIYSGLPKTSEPFALDFEADGESEENSVQPYPQMVFPVGHFKDESTGIVEHVNELNTDEPYTEDEDGTPTHPFCNVALCYQKYGYTRKQEDGSVKDEYDKEPEAQRGYEYMPANRVNSAPNFFVLYWLRALMNHLGIHIEENQMMDVEDMRRLFFVNTKCAHKEPAYMRLTEQHPYGKYVWVKDTRFSVPRIVPEYLAEEALVIKENCKFTCTDGKVDGQPDDTITVKVTGVGEMSAETRRQYVKNNSYLYNAYATSECFPDVDISEVIKAIESGFGVRFLFSNDYKRVRIVLLRNIFRDSEVQDISCDIIGEPVKTENNKRGFRMTYGDIEDTYFHYKGFDDLLQKTKEIWVDTSDKHDYTKWALNADYASLIKKVSAFDKTCYVTPVNGNAYGIKVDKDAKRYDELHPALFGFAEFMDAQDGDCSGEEETIETISVGFKPAIMNDLNMDEERDGSAGQRFALFVEEAMRPRRLDFEDGTDYNASDADYEVNSKLYAKEIGDEDRYVYESKMYNGIVKPGEFAITSDSYVQPHTYDKESEWAAPFSEQLHVSFSFDGTVNEGYRLYLQDNYEPNDDGISPIETHDWGLTLGIMRGSGVDARVEYTRDQDDKDNLTWEKIPGSTVTAHSDTCDNYGNEWDYDGKVAIIVTNSEAKAKMAELFPDSNISLTNRDSGNYISGIYLYQYYAVVNGNIKVKSIMFASELGGDSKRKTYIGDIKDYAENFKGKDVDWMKEYDKGPSGFGIWIEADSTPERKLTLLELQRRAFLNENAEPMYIDNGVGSRYGRFSLKLRAEKPNPYFNPSLPESVSNSRYLKIENENLRQRGLCDQFYKEYSYWVRNARIVKLPVRMELAQLLAIDKTKRVRVGDVMGFIRKMQFTVSNKTGLGDVTMEIMYI